MDLLVARDQIATTNGGLKYVPTARKLAIIKFKLLNVANLNSYLHSLIVLWLQDPSCQVQEIYSFILRSINQILTFHLKFAFIVIAPLRPKRNEK